ncbi:ABC transporter permease [Xylocopilactobacillus apis]|uniref:ABC transporter permease n=1 Tax=Xylocopilactobacillus apis TaxID=2932183 RepID=A0AAU9DHR5_9LACO|nr:ABC-2 family transporter protein [Xylocopilactobacillus apis]BDR56277.1 hypothetical protein KIMC2_08390 [Xylocopilactobacillus apis]
MKYLVIATNSLLARVTYKSNEITLLVTKILQMLVSIWMWMGIYHASGHQSINGFLLSDMVKYLIITNLLSILFSTTPIFKLANRIRDGSLNTLLYRPISIYGENFASYLGSQFLYLVVILILSVFTFDFKEGLLLGSYIIVSFIMFFTLMMVLGTLGFWLINMWPLRSGVNACYLVLGGLYFPLSFFGTRIVKVLEFNPFSLIADVPARMITGQNTYSIFTYFLANIIWIIVFLGLYKLLLNKGIKKYEGVGV